MENNSIEGKFNPCCDIPNIDDNRNTFVYSGLEDVPLDFDKLDSKEFTGICKKYSLIPYIGNDEYTSNIYLKFLYLLRKFSPTHGNCIKKISGYCFKSGVYLEKGKSNYSISSTQPVELSVLEKYIEILDNLVDYGNLNYSTICELIFDQLKTYGNCYVKITRYTDIYNVTKYILKVVDVRHCILRTNSKMYKSVLIYPELLSGDYNIPKKNLEKTINSNTIPVYPFFKKINDRTQESVLFISNPSTSAYGSIDSEQSILNLYSEYSNTLYRLKASRNNFVGRIILEVEGGDPVTENVVDNIEAFHSIANKINERFSNKNKDPNSVMYMERPTGSRPFQLAQIKPNSNEGYYRTIHEIDRTSIIGAHQWTERLLGDAGNSIFSGEAILNELTASSFTIKNYQLSVSSPMNIFFSDIIKEHYKNTNLYLYTLLFDNPVKKLVNETFNIPGESYKSNTRTG